MSPLGTKYQRGYFCVSYSAWQRERERVVINVIYDGNNIAPRSESTTLSHRCSSCPLLVAAALSASSSSVLRLLGGSFHFLLSSPNHFALLMVHKDTLRCCRSPISFLCTQTRSAYIQKKVYAPQLTKSRILHCLLETFCFLSFANLWNGKCLRLCAVGQLAHQEQIQSLCPPAPVY